MQTVNTQISTKTLIKIIVKTLATVDPDKIVLNLLNMFDANRLVPDQYSIFKRLLAICVDPDQHC